MPDHATDTTLALLESQGVSSHDARVLVLGLTYRPGVHETRFAPALDAIEEFRARDVSVYAHDPLLSVEEIEATGAIAATDPFEKAWDAVVLATGHEEYRELDTNRLHETMRTPVLVDGRDFFDAAELDGFEYARLGDGTTSVQ
jgi:UDP-N-acetyl-D-mannosaminuronic acid dehydrogenase